MWKIVWNMTKTYKKTIFNVYIKHKLSDKTHAFCGKELFFIRKHMHIVAP